MGLMPTQPLFCPNCAKGPAFHVVKRAMHIHASAYDKHDSVVDKAEEQVNEVVTEGKDSAELDLGLPLPTIRYQKVNTSHAGLRKE